MKGNVFGKWLQEFCSLVFVQTIQAFVLAMIMTIIISAMTGNGNETGNNEMLMSTGVLAIIALASISKVELLIKKIFGLEGGLGDKASMREGKGGILGTMMAFKMGKKLLNNVPDIVGGIKDRADVGKQEKLTKLRYADKINTLDRRYGMTPGAAGAGGSAGGAGAGAGAGAGGNTDARNGAGASSSGASGSGSSSGTAGGNNNNNIMYLEKRDKLLEDYQDKIQEINKKKRAAIKRSASGLVETVGAIGGGAIGATGKAIIDGADGDISIKGVLDSTSIGAGVGDEIGKHITNVTASAIELKKSNDRLKKDLRAYKSRKTEIENLLKDTNIDAGIFD